MGRLKSFKFHSFAALAVFILIALSGVVSSYELVPGKYVGVAQQFTDTFIKHGKDTYGPKSTPLFVDYLNVNTKECYRWVISDSYRKDTGYPKQWINANFSLDQQFLITLRELSKVNGDPKYANTAEEWAAYALENCVAPAGLGYWGTHACWDLLSDKYVGHTGDKSGTWPQPIHEMKAHSLDFDYLRTVNPQAVDRYISRYVAMSVQEWRRIIFGRHLWMGGTYGHEWDKAGEIEPNVKTPFGDEYRCMFGDVANPLMYWSSLYSVYADDNRAWRLTEMTLKRFKDTRYPDINLCAAQYAYGGTINGVESNINPKSAYYGWHRITDSQHYSKLPTYLMVAYEKLPAQKRKVFIDFVKEQYLAFAKWHVNQNNKARFRMNLDIKTGKTQSWGGGGYVASRTVTIYPTILYGFARAYRLTADSRFWTVIRNVIKGYGLGDIGTAPGENMSVKFEKYNLQPLVRNHSRVNINAFTVHALVELYHATGVRKYLELAAFTADEIVKQYFVNGMFILGSDKPWAQIRDHGALACLDVEAAMQGIELDVASKIPHDGFGLHVNHDGKGRTTDDMVLFSKTATIVKEQCNPPATPSFMEVAASANTMKINWTDVSDEAGYKLERRNDASGLLYKLIASPGANVTNYRDDNPGSNPHYRIRAHNDCGYSYYAVQHATGEMAFPGEEWQERTPESQGIDSSQLHATLKYLESQCGKDGIHEVVIIRNGYLIYQGDRVEKRRSVASVGKVFTSTVLGLLIDEGKCTLDTSACDYDPLLKEYYPAVRLRHFATMTSGYDAKGHHERHLNAVGNGKGDWGPNACAVVQPLFAPGEKYLYYDEAMFMFGRVLTAIAQEPMKDYLTRRIGDLIGMGDWAWNSGRLVEPINGIPVNWGCGMVHVNAKQLARLGHLYLNQGKWNGRQLISQQWVAQATRNQVPISIGLIMDSRQVEGRGIYGYHWWTKGTSPTKGENLPDAPEGTFYRSGAGHNMLFVVPKWNMVIVRLGNDGSSLKQMGTWNAVFRRIGASFIQD